MQFTNNEDIEASIEQTFGAVSDFENFERLALRRGAEIQRTDDLGCHGVGMTWKGMFDLRGTERAFKATILEFDEPHVVCGLVGTDGIDVELEINLIALSPNRTRLKVNVNLKPRTLSPRLILQSARLAKNNLNRRFKQKVQNFAQDIEKYYGTSRASHQR